MLTKEQIIELIVSGKQFFTKLPDGSYVARYTQHGAVQLVTGNGLKALPLQGSDLCWYIQATEEISLEGFFPPAE